MLIEVAESPSRSAIGEAINPKAYPVPEESDLMHCQLQWRQAESYTSTLPA